MKVSANKFDGSVESGLNIFQWVSIRTQTLSITLCRIAYSSQSRKTQQLPPPSGNQQSDDWDNHRPSLQPLYVGRYQVVQVHRVLECIQTSEVRKMKFPRRGIAPAFHSDALIGVSGLRHTAIRNRERPS